MYVYLTNMETPSGENTLDISAEVNEIMDDPRIKNKPIKLYEYLETLRDKPSLSLTMEWRSPEIAKWTKAFLETGPPGQKREVAIRCTERQKMEAANTFASGVQWINIEEI